MDGVGVLGSGPDILPGISDCFECLCAGGGDLAIVFQDGGYLFVA